MERLCAEEIEVLDLRPSTTELREEVLAGLRSTPKRLPAKLLYDRRGSELYERITRLEEYYLTRTETAILRARAHEIALLVGSRVLLVELGSGASEKTRILLDWLEDLAGYVPVDLAEDHLRAAAEALCRDYPELEILPVCADYTQPFQLPEVSGPVKRRVVFFPGSTIGNLEPDFARQWLAGPGILRRPGDALLLGVDLRKGRRRLEAAYDDARGVTAEFDRNVLRRLNRELGADFVPESFAHRAVYDDVAGRVEMHLVSTIAQRVRVGGETIAFEAGESIWTESSYKYDPDAIAALASAAGFSLERMWTDPERLFSVSYLVRR